jgi:hypothetical protein
MDIQDLRPGVLNDLKSWVSSKLTADPKQALQAQARVRPQAAVKLLT